MRLSPHDAFAQAHEHFEALWLARKFDDALIAARQAQSVALSAFGAAHPNYVRSLFDVGVAMQRAGQEAEAKAYAQKANALLDSLRIEAEHHADSIAAAELDLFDAERLAPFHSPQETNALFGRAAAILRGHPDAVDLLGETLVRWAGWRLAQGELQEAERLYRAAHDTLRSATASLWDLRAVLGTAHALVEQGRHSEAATFFQTADRHAFGNALPPQALYAFWSAYADCLEKSGQNEQANERRRRAEALLPKVNPANLQFRTG